MSAFHDNVLAGASGSQGGLKSDYKIERSLRFDSLSYSNLSRIASTTSNTTTWTWSGWVKRSELTSTTLASFVDPVSDAGNFLSIDSSGGLRASVGPSVLFLCRLRDPTSWMHIVYSVDTTQAVPSDRVKAYVNGVQQAPQSTVFPTQNMQTMANTAGNHFNIGVLPFYLDSYLAVMFGGYMTEINFIDGLALPASSFGELDPATRTWKPKKYEGSYGVNGAYLNFKNNSSLGALGIDYSGNGNNFGGLNIFAEPVGSPFGFTLLAGPSNDSVIDVPTRYSDGGNGRGNYPTLNSAMDIPSNGATRQIQKGNLLTYCYSANVCVSDYSTQSARTGKWYAEFRFLYNGAPAATTNAGIFTPTELFGNGGVVGEYDKGASYSATGLLVAGYEIYNPGYGASVPPDGIVGVALDCDNGAVYFSVNGVWQGSGVPESGASKTGAAWTWSGGTIDFGFGVSAVPNQGIFCNFGQCGFIYTPPNGYTAMNTSNLPEPVVKRPGDYVDVVTYMGNGTQVTPTSSLAFSPDFVWIKSRSLSTDHALYDSVRGAQKRLGSNSTSTEISNDDGLTSFNSNGFTLGSLAEVNSSASSYVAWCWDKGNTPGFDIVTYTGNGAAGYTVGHSLGVAPSMMIIKRLDGAPSNWRVYHKSIGETKSLVLNSLLKAEATPTVWNDTAPTSSVFTLGSSEEVNASGASYVAYLWSEVDGLSRFGSYSGTSNDVGGRYVPTGFRPSIVLIKTIDYSTNSAWVVYDSKRNGSNGYMSYLYPNQNSSEASVQQVDLLSNGFKLRSTSSVINGFRNYIYAAFAETPAKYSLAR